MSDMGYPQDFPAKAFMPVPNATEQELTPYQGMDVLPINMQAVMTFVPRGVSVVEPGFNHVTLLGSLGPVTDATYSLVMTLQATYERVRHLEAVVRAREERAEHWEAECRAAVQWLNETTPSNFKATKLKITQTGKAEEYTGLPMVLHVYGEVRDERWCHESPHKRDAKYVLVQDLTHDSPIQTWPTQLATAANEVLRRMGADPVQLGEDGSLSAKMFHDRAVEAIVAQAEVETQCREAVGLGDTDDITLLERLREMTKPVPAEEPAENPFREALMLELSQGLEQIFRLVGLPGAACPKDGHGLARAERIIPRVQELKTSYEQVLAERNDFIRRLTKYETVEGVHLPPALLEAPLPAERAWPPVAEEPVREEPCVTEERISEAPRPCLPAPSRSRRT